MMQTRYHARQRPEKKAEVSLVITTFETLEQIDLIARAVDISAGGLCIESDEPIEHGFVRLRDGQGSQRNGVMVWIKKLEEKNYRAGLRFLPFGCSDATSFDRAHPCLSVSDEPAPIVSMLVDERPRRPFSE